jgi:hypothetical protein
MNIFSEWLHLLNSLSDISDELKELEMPDETTSRWSEKLGIE